MALNAKNSDFITRTRQVTREVLVALEHLDALRLEWDSLFNSTVTADDFAAPEAGTNAQITLNDLTGVFTTQAAIDTLMDAGHRTNLLKAK